MCCNVFVTIVVVSRQERERTCTEAILPPLLSFSVVVFCFCFCCCLVFVDCCLFNLVSPLFLSSFLCFSAKHLLSGGIHSCKCVILYLYYINTYVRVCLFVCLFSLGCDGILHVTLSLSFSLSLSVSLSHTHLLFPSTPRFDSGDLKSTLQYK